MERYLFVPQPGDLVYFQGYWGSEVFIFLGYVGSKWTLGNFYNPKITKVYGGKNIYSIKTSCLNRFDIKRLSKHFKFKFDIGEKIEIFHKINSNYQERVLCEVIQHRLRYDHKKKKCYPAYRFKVLNPDMFTPVVLSSILRDIDNVSESNMRLNFNYNQLWYVILDEQ